MDTMKNIDEKSIKKHDGREDLAGEHPIGDSGQMILLVLFILAILIDLVFIHWLSDLRGSVSWYIRIPVSLPFFVLSYLLFKYSHETVFHEKREKLTVIDTGVYGIVRHPMYLASILIYLAVLILTLSFLGLIVWIITLIFYYYISRYEERILMQKLGAEYEDYRRRVKMFIPGIF
jgi:protein-S-isoprenylcysteine O-methyltransferase Ste14